MYPATNIGALLPNIVGGRCPHRPAVRPECFFQLRRGRRPRRPAIGETAPTFQSISGSGAEGETILNLGYGLPNPPLADRKRKSRNLGFLRAFGHFSRAGKVTRRRQNRPIQLPIPPKNGPMWASAPTAWKRELFSNNTADPMCPAAVGRKAPSNLCRGRCPHRPAVYKAHFFHARPPPLHPSALGSVTKKLLPQPGEDATRMLPPQSSTARRTMASPSPLPGLCCAAPL